MARRTGHVFFCPARKLPNWPPKEFWEFAAPAEPWEPLDPWETDVAAKATTLLVARVTAPSAGTSVSIPNPSAVKTADVTVLRVLQPIARVRARRRRVARMDRLFVELASDRVLAHRVPAARTRATHPVACTDTHFADSKRGNGTEPAQQRDKSRPTATRAILT